MKNLFDFATKELSQDAFLRWLLENYNCDDDDVRNASRALLISFINDDKYSENDIKKLWTKSQDHKADISVWLEMSDNYKYGIIIEDKTYSNEHNQLKNYKKVFDNDSWWKEHTNKMVYIFYKTGYIQEWEKEIIKEANWIEFSFDKIYEFWSNYVNSNNLIINNYANYIDDLYNKRNNINKPTGDDADIIKWRSYFDNTLKPLFSNYTCWVSNTYFGYAYICFHAKSLDFPGAPYLEIRGRDCTNDTFQARILTYEMDDNEDNALTSDECQKIRDEIRRVLWENKDKSLFKGNYGIKRNKQLGVSKKTLSIKTNEQFTEMMKQHLNEFERIMSLISFKYDKK